MRALRHTRPWATVSRTTPTRCRPVLLLNFCTRITTGYPDRAADWPSICTRITTCCCSLSQAALDDAYAARLAVLLPAGLTFVVSRQLQAVQHGMPKAMRTHPGLIVLHTERQI